MKRSRVILFFLWLFFAECTVCKANLIEKIGMKLSYELNEENRGGLAILLKTLDDKKITIDESFVELLSVVPEGIFSNFCFNANLFFRMLQYNIIDTKPFVSRFKQDIYRVKEKDAIVLFSKKTEMEIKDLVSYVELLILKVNLLKKIEGELYYKLNEENRMMLAILLKVLDDKKITIDKDFVEILSILPKSIFSDFCFNAITFFKMLQYHIIDTTPFVSLFTQRIEQIQEIDDIVLFSKKTEIEIMDLVFHVNSCIEFTSDILT